MLKHLSVKNYALIEELELTLHQGFSVITGETGAGKSIILGALSLILGKRAELKALGNESKKCVVEGHFETSKSFLPFFEEQDLDYDETTIIRREISPSGKSRAFINDSPVTLDVLNKLAIRLIDVHSQHQNLLLSNKNFQLDLLDNFAQNEQIKNEFLKVYNSYIHIQKELKDVRQNSDPEGYDIDYLEFLFSELESAKLVPDEQEELERELHILQNAGEIQTKLSEANNLINNEEAGLLSNLQRVYGTLASVAVYNSDLENLAQRIDSIRIELDDVRLEIEDEANAMEFDPEKAQQLDNRLSQLIMLQKKHRVNDVENLILKKEELQQKIENIANFGERIAKLEKQLEDVKKALVEAAHQLHRSRTQITAQLEKEIDELLVSLNMPHAKLKIQIDLLDEFSSSGNDQVEFLFSANKGQQPQSLTKVASGGELSRIMLALKAIMSKTKNLPTVIFDEIDTGVSGETAGKIGGILSNMGRYMQVVAISHLPQIASVGQQHFKVIKENKGNYTATTIHELSHNERVEELARMLSGEKITSAALENARALMH